MKFDTKRLNDLCKITEVGQTKIHTSELPDSRAQVLSYDFLLSYYDSVIKFHHNDFVGTVYSIHIGDIIVLLAGGQCEGGYQPLLDTSPLTLTWKCHGFS